MATKRRTEHVKIEDDWESAVGRAMAKKRPAGGWPVKPSPPGKKRGPKPKKKRRAR